MTTANEVIEGFDIKPPFQGEDLLGWAKRIRRQGFLDGSTWMAGQIGPQQVVIVAPVPQDPMPDLGAPPAETEATPSGHPEPQADEPRDERTRTDRQATRLFTIMTKKGFHTDPAHRADNLAWINRTLGRDDTDDTDPMVETTTALKRWEIEALFEALEQMPDKT